MSVYDYKFYNISSDSYAQSLAKLAVQSTNRLMYDIVESYRKLAEYFHFIFSFSKFQKKKENVGKKYVVTKTRCYQHWLWSYT